VVEVEEWHQRFLLGAENALRNRPKDDEALKDQQRSGDHDRQNMEGIFKPNTGRSQFLKKSDHGR
jgi:hypothetical protein